MKHKLLLSLFLFYTLAVNAQNVNEFSLLEDRLGKLARGILNEKDEFVRFHNSRLFEELLQTTLGKPGSYDFPFDSLISVSRLTPDDKSFRIFSWGVPRNDGSYECAGLIQLQPSAGRNILLYKLEDQSRLLLMPETRETEAAEWYGAIYYKILQHKHDNKIVYTLLGWSAPSPFVRNKIIEIIRFRKDGEPVFGASVFSRFPRKVKRVIFGYSANASMSMNYTEQIIRTRKRVKKKTVVREESKEMIVFDRLIPMEPRLEGQMQFYVPETNVFDGFFFENGKWVYTQDVDARNDERISPGREKPRMELFPEKQEKKK